MAYDWSFATKQSKIHCPFVHMIVELTVKTPKEIDKHEKKIIEKINCLLQFHIASESSKFSFNLDEVESFQKEDF